MNRMSFAPALLCIAVALPASVRAKSGVVNDLRRAIVSRALLQDDPEILRAVAALDAAGFLAEIADLEGCPRLGPGVEELERRITRWAKGNLFTQSEKETTRPLAATIAKVVSTPEIEPGGTAVLARLQMEFRLHYLNGELRGRKVYYAKRWVLFSPDFEIVEKVSEPVKEGEPPPTWARPALPNQ